MSKEEMNNNVVDIRSASQEVTARDLENVDPPVMVEIARPRLYRMYSESRLLSALLEAGVDKWEGYDKALEIYRGEEITEGNVQ